MRVSRALLLIVGGGFLVRLMLIAWRVSTHAVQTWEYDAIARNILSGSGYVADHLGTPYRSLYPGVFYIGLTALLYGMFPPGQTAVLIAQAIGSVLLGMTVYGIGRELWDHRAGLLAAALTVFHPGLLYYDTVNLHPLGFDALTGALAMLALLRVRATTSLASLVGIGMVLGVALHQRMSLIGLFPAGLLWIWTRPGSSRRVGRVAVCAVGLLVVVSPWIMRNIRMFGHPVMSTAMGEMAWRGNAPGGDGSSYLPSGTTVLDAAPAEFRQQLRAADEWGQSQLFSRAAGAHASAHPWQWAAGCARKFLYFWTVGPGTGRLYPRAYYVIYLLYYAGAMLLAVRGAVRLAAAERRTVDGSDGVWLVAATGLLLSLVQCLLYVELRHRWAIEPLLLVLTAVGVVAPWPRHRWAGAPAETI